LVLGGSFFSSIKFSLLPLKKEKKYRLLKGICSMLPLLLKGHSFKRKIMMPREQLSVEGVIDDPDLKK
jgi:hypothetical protein